jgi:hypothetical protein
MRRKEMIKLSEIQREVFYEKLDQNGILGRDCELFLDETELEMSGDSGPPAALLTYDQFRIFCQAFYEAVNYVDDKIYHASEPLTCKGCKTIYRRPYFVFIAKRCPKCRDWFTRVKDYTVK